MICIQYWTKLCSIKSLPAAHINRRTGVKTHSVAHTNSGAHKLRYKLWWRAYWNYCCPKLRHGKWKSKQNVQRIISAIGTADDQRGNSVEKNTQGKSTCDQCVLIQQESMKIVETPLKN